MWLVLTLVDFVGSPLTVVLTQESLPQVAPHGPSTPVSYTVTLASFYLRPPAQRKPNRTPKQHSVPGSSHTWEDTPL